MSTSSISDAITTIGVVGAGTMGAGIAQLAAQRGFTVILYDVAEEYTGRGLERIRARYEREVSRGRLTPEARDQTLARVQTTTRLDDLAKAQVVIEAAPEDLGLKRQLFAQLSRVCPPDTLLASNTSALSITNIAGAAEHPERVAGMHFFNPAPVLPLVEVVSGHATSPATADAIVALAERLGKTSVRARDTPGFIVNRVARPFYGEALRILGERIATPAQIDQLVRAAGFKMGPFELLDLIGLDVNFAVTQAVYDATFQEPRFRPHPLQARLVAAGTLGQKTGRGFYQYEAGQRVDEPVYDPLAGVAPLARPANVLLAGQGPLVDDLALALQRAGQQVTVYAGEISAALERTGIPRARRLRDALLTTTVAIEATLGPRELKRAYWYELDEALSPAIPILTLGLGYSATELGSWSAYPERVVGFGYAGPFGDAALIELAPGLRTSVETVRRAAAFVRALGKEVAAVGEQPGQVTPRILSMLVNEACFALDEAIATPADLDTALRLGVNYPRGPLEWGDRLGLDAVVATLDGLCAYYGEERYRVAPGLRRALYAGRSLRG